MTNRANKIDKKCVNLDMEYNFLNDCGVFFLYMPVIFLVEFSLFSFSKKKRDPPLGIKWDAPNVGI